MTRGELEALIDGGSIEACLAALEGMPEAERRSLGRVAVAAASDARKGEFRRESAPRCSKRCPWIISFPFSRWMFRALRATRPRGRRCSQRPRSASGKASEATACRRTRWFSGS